MMRCCAQGGDGADSGSVLKRWLWLRLEQRGEGRGLLSSVMRWMSRLGPGLCWRSLLQSPSASLKSEHTQRERSESHTGIKAVCLMTASDYDSKWALHLEKTEKKFTVAWYPIWSISNSTKQFNSLKKNEWCLLCKICQHDSKGLYVVARVLLRGC